MPLDLNNTITAAGLIAGAFTLWWRSRKVEHKVDKVHTQLNGIVDDKDAPTIRQLLEDIAKLDRYSHDRNHDILTGLTPSNATLALLLISLCDHDGIDWREAQPGLASALARVLMEAKVGILSPPPTVPATEQNPSGQSQTEGS